MINIDVNPDPHSDPTHSPDHHHLLQSSPNNFPSTQDNDRQYQDSLSHHPSHSLLKHPFQKNFSSAHLKANGLGPGNEQDLQKAQEEGRIIPKRLKTLAEQEAKVHHRHKFQMKASQRQYSVLGNESEGDLDYSSGTEEEEDEKKSSGFFKRWRRNKKGGKSKKKKKKHDRNKLDPIAKRILIDDVARQKDYYGKDYQAERVVTNQKFALAIARIALKRKDPKASDAFRIALEKVNPRALETARKELEMKKRDKIKKSFASAKKKLKKPLDPNSTFILVIELILFCTILTETFFATYVVAFTPEEQLYPSYWPLIVCYVCDFIFILRILLYFDIAVYDKGELSMNFRFIAWHYFKTMLLIDVFSLLNIIGYFFLDSRWRALMVLAVIRLYKIPIILDVFKNYFQVSREIGSLIRVIELVLVLYVYAHMCGCALYGVGRHEGEPSWITSNGFEGESPSSMYVISVYWAAQTVTTVGYGDITPVRIRERILLIVIFLGSAIVIGYLISTIASILAEMNSFTTENMEKIRLLKKYMDDKGLKKETQDRIMKYVRYYLSRENISKIQDSDMMQFLSENLKEDIIKEVNVKLLSECYVFSHNFGRPFLLAVAKELTEKSYGPDEYIFQDTSSRSAYFILGGKVELIYGKCNIRIALLEKGGMLGFLAFFTEEPRAITAKSLEFTSLFELSRELFLQKLEEYPNENEAFCLIKDNIGLYKSNQNLVNFRCYLCGKLSHLALECPILYWYKSPLKVISKHLVKQERLRRSFRRRDRERFSALGRIKDLQEAAEKIQNSDNNDIVQGSLILGREDRGSYSSIDEIMDRNIYDLEPLVFTGDMVESRELEVCSKSINISDEEKRKNFQKEVFIARPKVEPGEIQTFVMRQYDAYMHNLNLDQVKNWEIYFPHNNVQRVLDALEIERLKRIAKAHHLPETILKSFKFGGDKSKSDPRTMRLCALNAKKSQTEKKNGLGQSQMYVIPAERRGVSGPAQREEEPERPNEQLDVRKKSDKLPDGDDIKENIPPLPEENNLQRPLNEEIRTEKGDEEMLKEEAPSLVGDQEEGIEERLEDSREYCKKVLGSDFDGLMKKFTDMLMESMKKANEDESEKSQGK